MGNIPCNCLSAATVNPVEIDPTGQPLTHFEQQLVMLTKSHEKRHKAETLQTQASHSVPVIKWDSDSEDEVPRQRPYKTAQFLRGENQSASTRSNDPEKISLTFRRCNDLETSMVRKEIVMGLITEYTEKVLLRELPKCPYFVDYPAGRWVRNASGTIFFDDSHFPAPSGEEIAPKTPTYFLPDGRIYYGETNHNLQPHGTGILIIPEPEMVYKGDFKDGLPNGIGFMEYHDFRLEGYWQRGEFTHGFIRGSNFEYEGQFVDGRPEGEGRYRDKKNNVDYKGEFLLGKYEGAGQYSTKNYTFKGEFHDGRRNGKGVMEFGQPTRVCRGKWMNDHYLTSNY